MVLHEPGGLRPSSTPTTRKISSRNRSGVCGRLNYRNHVGRLEESSVSRFKIPLLRGSHGAGEYASPGGHLEHLEAFADCARREVREETGLEIDNLRFLRVMNVTTYAPKHYVDLAFAADWVSGEPQVLEPEKVESWGWYPLDALPEPLFATRPTALEALRTGRTCWDVG
jgi:8-oxo-dGTP diphosphatase